MRDCECIPKISWNFPLLVAAFWFWAVPVGVDVSVDGFDQLCNSHSYGFRQSCWRTVSACACSRTHVFSLRHETIHGQHAWWNNDTDKIFF